MALGLASSLAASPTGVPDDEAKARGWTKERFRPAPVDLCPGMDVTSLPASGEVDWPDQLLDMAPATSAAPPAPAADGPVASPAGARAALPLTVGAGSPPRARREVVAPVLNESETMGRNTWMLWCGGNEAFWSWLSSHGYGFMDLLKLIDSRQRTSRFERAGLINEPGMRAAARPDSWGLWIDEPDSDVLPWTQPYYGTVEGRPRTVEDVYGRSSGVLGLRVFDNPRFDAKAQARWDAGRYHADPDYYNDPKLEKPYRVGMSCAFCHVSFNPLTPPADVANPEWENISGNIGAQYLRVSEIFGNLLPDDNFVKQILKSQMPGTIDTSLIASDNINNANSMNPVFNVPQRVARAFANPPETLAPMPATLPSVWADPPPGFESSNGNPRQVPRILMDGADTIGVYGALARVYLNIGTFHEQWIRLHEPLVGFLPAEAADAGQSQMPFRIEDCMAHSVYWTATQDRVEPLRDYFLAVTPPMRLLDADPGATERPAVDASLLARGRRVFARNCIACHSSIQPANRQRELDERAARGEPFDTSPGLWLRDPSYAAWALAAVETPEFWQDNYLSTDYRVPVSIVGTNPGRALATNALTGHMWEDFTSESYRKLPSVGSLDYHDPFLNETQSFMPRHATPCCDQPPGGGGPGYYRPATLVSIWATAPFLHTNALGTFTNDPSVSGRLRAFDDGIAKLLWPARRLAHSDLASAEQLREDHGFIYRTTTDSWLTLPAAQVPTIVSRLPWITRLFMKLTWVERLQGVRWLPSLLLLALGALLLLASKGKRWRRLAGYAACAGSVVAGVVVCLALGRIGDVRIGPIPAGTPVNLLANMNPDAPEPALRRAIVASTRALAEIESRHLTPEDADRVLREKVAPALLSVSKCPDFVLDKGHYFPWFADMTDEDKRALIELLKTF